ncbi:hypothetical protein KKI22_03570 [Patescibacteria group bacterium]|nr:hypothetical protein [Patescibacteria group bacterium]
MLAHDLLLLLWTYFVLFLLQIIALPLIFHLSNKFVYLRDSAWGFGRIFSILLLSLLVWNLAFLKIPINTDLGVSSLFFILIAVSSYFSWRFFWFKKNFLKDFITKFGKIILIEEIVLLAAMVFLFITRSFQPETLGLEKFMDAGFIQAYLKSPTLPVGDIWFANQSINYYSFGQFYNAILIHLWQVDLTYGYNLLLITIFGLFCLELFSLAFNLRANLSEDKVGLKAAVAAGFFAVFLVALGANGHTLWYFLSGNSFDTYWYPDATRFIERTIHEFPAYSFVVCDLHAHVLSLPISLLMLLTIFVWLKELLLKKVLPKLPTILIGILFGVLVMTNTWDIMIYGLLLVIISFILLIKDKSFFLPLFLSASIIFTATAVISTFWFLNFTAIAGNLLIAREHTAFWQLLVLYGPHLFWALLFLIMIRSFFLDKKPILILILALFILVLFLIIFPELFYFEDIYHTYPRANTMFKLVFQGFMLLGVILSLFFSYIFFEPKKDHDFFAWRSIDLRQFFSHKKKKLFLFKVRLRRFFFLYLPIVVFLFFSTLVYPYSAYRSYYGGLRNYQGLNGLAWFERKYPEDFILMNYLKENEEKQVNIVEAVGESYSEFARISAFSGMPTILGWRVHEWLWRAGWDKPAVRTAEVEEIYNHPSSEKTKSYLEKYQIKYIFVGTKELEAYPKIKIQELLSLGEIVISRGNHYLIKLF